MTQFLDTPLDKSLSATGAWTDIDLSGDVPVGATSAIFRVYNDSFNPKSFGLRKNGSTDNVYNDLDLHRQQFAIVGLDAARKCEGKIETTDIDFFLVGYTEADATLLTNATDKSIAITSTWTDIDLSGDIASGSVAAIFLVVNNDTSFARNFGLRKNGSTDDRHLPIYKLSRTFMVVGVDANRKCQGYIASTNVDFFLLGYLTMGQAETNAHDKSLGATGSYIDIDESANAPSGATGVFGELSGQSSCGVRKNGTSFDYYADAIAHDSIMVGLDTNRKWEGKIEDVTMDFYTMGYFVAGTGEKTKESSVGLSVFGTNEKQSSVGISIQETNTKESSIGITVQEAAWLSGYTYRKPHTINGAVGAGTNYQQKIKAYYDKRPVGSFTYLSTTGADVYSSQGIATDGTYFYTTAGDDNKHLYKFNSSWVLQSSHDCSADWPAGCTQVNHIFYKDGKLYLGACDHPDATPEGWIMVYNTSDLSYDTVHSVGAIECEGCAYYDGYWWVIRGDSGQIKKYSTGWVHQTDYNLTHIAAGNALFCYGYQGIMWKDDFIYVVVHRDCQPDEKCDVYYFDGTNFTLVKRMDTPTPYCSQGLCLDPDGETVWWAERDHGGVANDDRVVKTTIAFDNEEVGLNKHCKTDFGDLRITKSDGSTIYAGNSNGWREHKINSVFAIIWWKMLDDLGTAKNIYLYYGNNAATWADGAISSVMDHVNDFETGTVQDFTNAYNGGSVQASTTEKYEGSYSIKTLLASGGVYSNDKTFWSTAKKAIDIWMLSTSNNAEATICWLVSGNNIKRVILSVESDGVEYTGSAGTKKIIAGDYTGMWVKYSVKLNADNNTVDIYAYNDKLILLGHATDVAFSEVSRTYRDILLYDAVNYNDLIFSHKYTVPEPTCGSWGAEETPAVTKESSIGLCVVSRGTKASSIGLSIKDYGAMGCVMTYETGSVYNDQTVAANNATTNDVQLMFDTVGDILYCGDIATFGALKIKYSTKGVIGAGVIVIEYSKGGSAWGTLTCTDDTNNFTEDPGTYFLSFFPPGDWATDTVNGKTHYWIRHRLTSNEYVSNPILDQLWVLQRKTKESSIGLRVISCGTKASSMGLSVQETNTKASSVGLQIVERHTKASSVGLQIVERHTKASSVGLSVQEMNTKASSVSLSVYAEGTNASTLGLTVANQIKKYSSVGLTISGTNIKASSLGLSIQDTKTHESSLGISVINTEIKASTAGLRIVDRGIKGSSASLTVKATYTKESSVGLRIATPQSKVSSIGLTISGTNTLVSSVGLRVYESALKKGLFYAKLGDTILETVMPENFRISKEMNKIPSFEFEVANSEVNRTAIAANPTKLLKIYWQHHGLENHIFTGVINADGIEYVSLTNIRITGFSSYVKLGWPLFKHLNAEDAEPVNTVWEYNGVYTDYTTQANNANINDVPVTFGGVNHCLYVGEANPFWGLQVKYSTPGIPAGAVIVIEFSKGSGIWETLDVLDETNAFTEDAGTYDLIIPHPPSDWVRNTVDGISKFWLRWRVVSGTYSTSPKLDQIHTVNVDVYRVFYLATSARAILLDALEDTEYSMDPIDTCPEDEINLLAEYESPLRVIAAIPAALTWTDIDGSKKSYQWWIDEANRVHMKKKRGTTHSDDITGDLTIFNNLVDYFNVSNRLFGFSKRDGLSQIRAIIENKASQTTHALREIAVPKNEIGKYLTLKESLEKDITYSKEPMQRIKGAVTTEFWGQRGYEVGDTITLHQGEWVVEEGEFQIVKVDIGPVLTQLNLGISREHLEGLKSNMKRAFDISNVQMHGSTTVFSGGPETSNYERKANGDVYSAKLKLDMPSDIKKTHKMLVSWTIGPYRASVNEEAGTGAGHNHGGFSGEGGALAGGNVSLGGAFTPDMLADGDFIPEMLSEAHTHYVYDTLYIQHASSTFNRVVNDWIHDMNHRHSMGSTNESSDYALAVYNLIDGTKCTEGWCIKTQERDWFSAWDHTHSNSGRSTGYSSPNAWVETLPSSYVLYINPTVLSQDTNEEDPAHLHDGIYEPVHDHPGVYEYPHNDHAYPSEPAHDDHIILTEPGLPVDLSYGIHEEAPGTVLELVIDGEVVGQYSGDQTEIRVDGYLSGSAATIEIQPIAAETGKKGGATIWVSGLLFIEPKKF